MPRITFSKVAAALAFAAPLVLGGFMLGRHVSGDTGFRVFQAVFSIVSRDALDSIPTDKHYEHAARGVVAGLDDNYADLFSPEDYARFNRNALGNRYGGIGLRITRANGYVTVWKVIDGGPASQAGVQPGDRVAMVADSNAAGWTTDRVSNSLTGDPGTPVHVVFERTRTGAKLDLTLTRAVISVPAVPFATTLDNGVGYIPLKTFSDRSAGDVAGAAQRLQNLGVHALVLDLRGNPGGSLDQAVQLASLFITPGQPVVRVKYRREDDTLRAAGGPTVPANMPVAVLIDGFSASASEIVAGALQDYDRGLLVGSTSFGKGLVQGAYRLPDGWVLKLTTAHWFTPSGRLIQRTRADSAHSTAQRPVFHSTSGREILGGGGITPDLTIGSDTLTAPEQQLARFLGQSTAATNEVLDGLAVEIGSQVTAGFQVLPAWREMFLRGLRDKGINPPDSLLAQSGRYIDRLLEGRIAGFALTDSTAFTRNAPQDAQLQRALERLRNARSQRELYAATNEPRRRG